MNIIIYPLVWTLFLACFLFGIELLSKVHAYIKTRIKASEKLIIGDKKGNYIDYGYKYYMPKYQKK